MRVLSLHLAVLFFAGSVLFPGPAHAQPAVGLSEEAQISLLTILPGDEIYSIFGHSAFRVYDPLLGIDVTFNYGTFDFGNPFLFSLQFTYGRLDYFLSVGDYERALRAYRYGEERPVIEQVLNLDAAQREAVFRFLQVNAREENRYYRYDFLFDNCSTRLRDVLLATLGDDLRFAPEPDPRLSFRRLLDPYVADRPFLDLGFDLLLGTPTDRVASPHETMFLPLYLMEAFDHARVQRDGAWQPLVARKDTVYWIDGYETLESTLPWATLLAWLLLALGLGLAIFGRRRGEPARPVFDALLLGLAGLAGLLMVFMWFFSEHTVTNNNWNLLWAWPTHLVAAAALARRVRRPWLRRYLAAAAAAALLTALGWYVWPQDLHPAVFPLLLLLAFRSLRQAYALRPRVAA